MGWFVLGSSDSGEYQAVGSVAFHEMRGNQLLKKDSAPRFDSYFLNQIWKERKRIHAQVNIS